MLVEFSYGPILRHGNGCIAEAAVGSGALPGGDGKAGQTVAVLVDEYDKPIPDALDDPEVALANRHFLRGLYGVIKSSDAHVRFTFVTGKLKQQRNAGRCHGYRGDSWTTPLTNGCSTTSASSRTC